MTHKPPTARAAGPWQKICAVLLAAFMLLPAYAQTTTGRLTVTVKDPRGEPVAGAPVTVSNQDGAQTVRTTVTDQQGVAVIENLPPGLYTVLVNVQGFRADPQRDVAVRVGETATAAVQLTRRTTRARRGASRTPAAVPKAELDEDPGAGEPGEPRGGEISSLPNLNYDLTPALENVLGAVSTGPSSLGRVIVDGKGNDQQTVRLDGVDFTPQVDFPSADAAASGVGSFQKPEVAGNLDKSSTRSGAFGYEPRHGPGSGIVTETPTYAGVGNDFKWALQFYGDMRNDALNSRNFFDFDGDNALRRARFGGKFATLFGEKSRAGVFVAYDGWRGRVERNVYEAVPSDAASGGSVGSLSQLMRGFLPPGTEVVDGSLSPDFVVARRRTRTTAESNAYDVRFDYRPHYPGLTASSEALAAPSARSVLTLRLTHQRADNRVPEGVTGRSQRQEFAFTNALVGYRMVQRVKPVRNENSAKRSKKDFGHFFKFGFNRTHARMGVEAPPTAGFDLSQSLYSVSGSSNNVEGLPLAPPPEGQPLTIPFASLGGLLSGPSRGLDLRPTSYSGVYDFAKLVTESELHELHAGFEARFIRLDYDRLGGLAFSFPSVAALRSGTPAHVTFLSDLSAQGPFRPGTGPRQARQEFYMGYFQMVSQFRWKAHQQAHDEKPSGDNLEPALTLTYGLRYDHFGGVRERDDRAVVVDPLTGDILPAGAPFYRVDHANVQPRFALAYRFSDAPPFRNTVLRAGVGLYSGVPRIGDLLLPIDSDRYSLRVNAGASLLTTAADMRKFFDSNTSGRLYQPLAFARDYSPLERSIKWDVRIGHTHNGYEYSAYYTGNVGRNLALANFANRIVGVKTNTDPRKPAEVTREFGDAFDEFQYRRGGGRSSFNALSLQLARDADDTSPSALKWLKLPVTGFSAKYTLSRSVGNASGTLMSNPLDPDADFGDNAGVARHSFTVSGAYELWRVLENRRSDDRLLGWKIVPSFRVSSGLPLIVRLQRPDVVYVDGAGNIFGVPEVGRTAVLNTPGGGGAAGAYVPNLVPGVNPYAGGFADRLYLDPAAFSIPAPGALGTIRRGQLRGPLVANLDLSVRRNLLTLISRNLSDKEADSRRLEFQVDVYNVFNRTNFINPSASLPSALGTLATTQVQPGAPFRRAGAGTFGYFTAADQGRLVQFSLTLKFNQGFTK